MIDTSLKSAQSEKELTRTYPIPIIIIYWRQEIPQKEYKGKRGGISGSSISHNKPFSVPALFAACTTITVCWSHHSVCVAWEAVSALEFMHSLQTSITGSNQVYELKLGSHGSLRKMLKLMKICSSTTEDGRHQTFIT